VRSRALLAADSFVSVLRDLHEQDATDRVKGLLAEEDQRAREREVQARMAAAEAAAAAKERQKRVLRGHAVAPAGDRSPSPAPPPPPPPGGCMDADAEVLPGAALPLHPGVADALWLCGDVRLQRGHYIQVQKRLSPRTREQTNNPVFTSNPFPALRTVGKEVFGGVQAAVRDPAGAGRGGDGRGARARGGRRRRARRAEGAGVANAAVGGGWRAVPRLARVRAGGQSQGPPRRRRWQ